MAYQLFEQFKLHDLLKPYYYATLSYLTDERQQDYLRMGDELKPTVEEVIASVAQFREMYALENQSKKRDNNR